MLNAVKPFVDFYRVVSFSDSTPPKRTISRFLQTLTHGWRAAARYRRLEVMSDRELARLGLDRSSIGRHAFFSDLPFDRR